VPPLKYRNFVIGDHGAMEKTRKVVLADYTLPLEMEMRKLEVIKEETDAMIEIVHSPEDLPKALEDADVAIVHRAKMTAEVIENAKNLKLIVKCGIGVDTIDVDKATERGIYLVNDPEYCKIEVAEHTIGLILALSRKIAFADRIARIKAFPKTYDFSFMGLRLHSKTIGLIGIGNIGQLVAERAKPFGMRVFAYTPRLTQKRADKYGVTAVDLDTLLNESDIISLHLPITKDTHYLIGKNEIAKMKKTAIIINTSRGKLIDEKALAEALKEGKMGGAGLDVSENEPISPDNPLLNFDNVVVTPHMSWASPGSLEDIEMIAARQVIQFFKGEVPDFLINKQVRG
jgi:D-3-phosphoglycerate dehydrogenase